MKTSFEVGGPAFPQALLNDEGEVYYFHDWKGMSLRDYFAAKALQGLLAGNPETLIALNEHTKSNGSFSCVAYKMADAMLEARK